LLDDADVRHILTLNPQGGRALGEFHTAALRNAGPVLVAMHTSLQLEWDLHGMAQLAGMARARFAVRFREVTGQTPGD
jgi:AraC-like DNA-binding protein